MACSSGRSPDLECGSKICRVLTWQKFDDLLKRFNDDRAWNPDSNSSWISTRPYGRMWFSFPHAFEKCDPKEATFPAINSNAEQYCDMVARNLGLDQATADTNKSKFLASPHDKVLRSVQQFARLCGASCWYGESSPSRKVWSRYGGKESLAVQTTIEGLLRSLGFAVGSYSSQSVPRIAKVQYVCHESHEMPSDGVYSLLAIKSMKFLNEKEVRVVARSPWISKVLQCRSNSSSILCDDLVDECEVTANCLRGYKVLGFRLPCCLTELFNVGKILLPSSADPDFQARVRNRLSSAGLSTIDVI